MVAFEQHESFVNALGTTRKRFVLSPQPSKVFESEKEYLNTVFQEYMKTNALDAFGVDTKMLLELAFQEQYTEFKQDKTQTNTSHTSQNFSGLLVDLSFWAAENGYLDKLAPLNLMESIFDSELIEECVHVFAFLQSRLSQILAPALWTKAAKLPLLKICNGILRRLSKTNNTIFCGQILMLLAYCMPLDEPSGQNKNSKFNTENATVFEEQSEDEKEGEAAEAGEAGEAAHKKKEEDAGDRESGEVKDGSFYRTLWGLQSFFNDPSQLKAPEKWLLLVSGCSDVLSAFESSKLSTLDALTKSDTDSYFPKYLTSSKLLNLQLRDPAFRRHILLQCMILFDSLKSPMFLTKIGVSLNAKQEEMIGTLQSRVHAVLESTPTDGDGKQFAQETQHILQRERQWKKWKDDDKCPDIQVPPTPFSAPIEVKLEATLSGTKKKKAVFEPVIDEYGNIVLKERSGRINMGMPELARLWDLPDNRSAPMELQRQFVPDHTGFMQKMFDEDDPELQGNMPVEDDEKLKNNPTYVWRALRLMGVYQFDQFLKSSGNVKVMCDEVIKKRQNVETDKTKGADAEGKINDEDNKDGDGDVGDGEGVKEEDTDMKDTGAEGSETSNLPPLVNDDEDKEGDENVKPEYVGDEDSSTSPGKKRKRGQAAEDEDESAAGEK